MRFPEAPLVMVNEVTKTWHFIECVNPAVNCWCGVSHSNHMVQATRTKTDQMFSEIDRGVWSETDLQVRSLSLEVSSGGNPLGSE
jgi:hypothetical protein